MRLIHAVIALLFILVVALAGCTTTPSQKTTPVSTSTGAFTDQNTNGNLSASDYNQQGLSLVNQSKYTEAVQAYDLSLKLDPNNAQVWDNKGVALGQSGKLNESLDAFTQGLKVDPNDSEIWNNKGAALGQIGEYAAAADALQHAVTIMPNYTEAWYNLGSALSLQGKNDEAILAINQGLKSTPEDKDLLALKASLQNRSSN